MEALIKAVVKVGVFVGACYVSYKIGEFAGYGKVAYTGVKEVVNYLCTEAEKKSKEMEDEEEEEP